MEPINPPTPTKSALSNFYLTNRESTTESKMIREMIEKAIWDTLGLFPFFEDLLFAIF
jgi:predicted DNA-binding protein